MTNGLAIWHYPHRSVLENVEYFVKSGFGSVSLHGDHMYGVCLDCKQASDLAEILKRTGVVMTVHAKLPASHGEDDVKKYKNYIDVYAEWQKKYGLISVLSFDVPGKIRDGATPYIEYALEKVGGAKIAVEDFGLTESELAQLKPLRGNARFGHLIDIGHMYIRLRGLSTHGATLFTNSALECPACDAPSYDEFLRAIRSKEFPIFEMHLHNNDGVRDLHYFLDDGTLDIDMIARVIRDVGFDGVMTIESAPGFQFECKYPESDKRIAETFEIWKRAIAE